MTKDEIEKMPAGLEMNVKIAISTGLSVEHLPVMYEEGNTEDGTDGWCGFVCPRCHNPKDMLDKPCVKNYSTDDSTALELLKKMSLTDFSIEKVGNHYCVNLMVSSACAETLSLAICRAYLLLTMAL